MQIGVVRCLWQYDGIQDGGLSSPHLDEFRGQKPYLLKSGKCYRGRYSAGEIGKTSRAAIGRGLRITGILEARLIATGKA